MPKKGNIPWNKGKKGLQVAWNKGLKGYSKNIKRTKEWNENISKSKIDKYRANGGSGCYITLHNKAWRKIGKEVGKCEHCGITNKEHKIKIGARLEMHNTLEPKNYTIMKKEAWKVLCKSCHMKID